MTTKKDLFLITGATGKTGAQTVRLLRQQGRSVRALVHTLDDRVERLAEQGAEVVQGDLLDFPSVSAATAGVTAAYFNYPITPGLIEATANFAQAASEAGVHAEIGRAHV
jgi:NAD(P)H dehydrogenase (quinone)